MRMMIMATAPNPYAKSFPPGFFKILYDGYRQDFYVFRVVYEGKKSFDACLFSQIITEYLFNETFYEWYFGNQFAGKFFPRVEVDTGPNGKDIFVLFKSRIDVELFAREFSVKFKY